MSGDGGAGSLPVIGWFDEPIKRSVMSVFSGINSKVEALDLFLRAAPHDPRSDRLRYRLEGLRIGNHALVEVELLARPPSLSPADQERAERLWGGDGDVPHLRLGLPPDAERAALGEALEDERRFWQLRLAHPASTRGLRIASEAALRTCDELRGRLGR